MTQEEIKKKFSIILSSLPEDKRAALYNKLKSMPASEREKMISEIVKKYEGGANKPANKPVNKPSENKKDITNNSSPRKAQKKLKKSVKNAITIAVISLVLVISVVILIINRENLFGNKDVATEETTATTATMENTTTVAETTETTVAPTPTPSPSPTPSPIPVDENSVDLTGLTVVIDPGHQLNTSDELENCASWLGTEKPRCTSGAVGVTSGVLESELTLEYSVVIGAYLEQLGANVIYTRTENDVDVSNQERASIATSNNADVFIRIHTDAANDSLTSGVRIYVPDSGDYSNSVVGWGQTLGNIISEREGLELNDVRSTHLYTGLNYANSVPSFQLNLGYLTNSDDEAILINEENMISVAYGVAEFCSEFLP